MQIKSIIILLIRMQSDMNKQISTSRKRLNQINQQEKQLADIFAISNFYKGQRFDLQALKQKIKDVQIKKSASRDKYHQSISYHQPTKQHQKMPRRQLLTRQKVPTKLKGKISSISNQNPQLRHQQRLPSSNNLKTIKNNRYGPNLYESKKQSRIKQHIKDRSMNGKLQPLLSDVIIKIAVQSKQQLAQYQHKIQSLWSLYELLTKIIQSISNIPFSQEISLIKYVEDICSEKLQFILQFLESKVPKRYHKTIVLSRLLQNMSIIYLSLQLCQHKKVRCAYLINFIGFCTSNLIFLIRLFTLFHEVHTQPCKNVINIIETIRTFQLQSYKAEIISLKELVLRMEHNNQIVNLMQVKLCQNSSREFQTCISQFLKHADRERQPLFEYAHYIFEFLAYYLHKQKLLGTFAFLQIAPSPYLALKFPQTVVIEPWHVFFTQKKDKIFVRAYTQHFITQLARRCNVVLWSDLMPNQLDPLVSLLPSAPNIHYLYRYHCKYENNNYVKILWRIGSLPDNVIIIDRDSDNFMYDIDDGIQLPWKGQKRDKKLLDLLQLLIPVFNSGKKLSKQLGEIRQQINILKRKRPYHYRKNIINGLNHLKAIDFNSHQENLEETL